MVEAIQRALVERGFDPGKIDGVMGWRTRGALRFFQRSAGLPDTGRADDATLAALGLEPPGDARADADTPQGAAPRVGPAPTPTPGVAAPEAETPRADMPEVETPGDESATPASTEAHAPETPDDGPATTPGAGAAETRTEREEPTPAQSADTETMTDPETMEAPPDFGPVTESSTDTPGTDAPRTRPAPATGTDAPGSGTPGGQPVTETAADVPGTRQAPRATSTPTPAAGTDTPGSGTADGRPPTETVADTPTMEATRVEPARVEPARLPGATAPKAGTSHAESTAAPSGDTSRTGLYRTEPAPKRAARPKLGFATLGWRRPQTGAEALERLDAMGAPRDFERGTGSLFVPNPELVFVLRAGERIPGLDCDPEAGRLAVELVFGPGGPVIFTPAPGGGYCRMGLGIAIVVGGALEMRRIDWGETQYPQGAVRITNEGLEYVR